MGKFDMSFDMMNFVERQGYTKGKNSAKQERFFNNT